jgi:cytidylate kinase
MRIWALALESRKELDRQQALASPQHLIHPYIAITRESGVNASEIAQQVAKKLGWDYIDRELLNFMAEKYHWSRVALDYVDERTASWFHETFGRWLDRKIVSQAEYVSRLGQILLLAAQHKSMVVVGRGAQFILSRELGRAVRIIAPKRQRIKEIMTRLACSHHDAEEFIDETDKGRGDFIRRYFQHEVADAGNYDLTINLEHTSREAAVNLILGDYLMQFEPRRVSCAFHMDEEENR